MIDRGELNGASLGRGSPADRLKILFLPAWYPSEDSPLSGVFIREHARAASLCNDVVVVHSYGSPDQTAKGLYQVGEAVEDGVRTVRIRYRSPSTASSSPISRLMRLLVTFRYLSGFLKGPWRPDVIHAHVYSAGVPAVLLGLVHRIPVVVTEHWTWFALHKLTWERRLAARFALNRARLVLPVSGHLREQLRQYGVRGPFRLIPNVVDTRLFCPSNAERGIDDPKRILLVANLSEQKGVSYLLRAMQRVTEKRTNLRLDIVGDTLPGVRREDYEEMSIRLGLETVVRFHGPKPRESVAEFMRSCDFFVQPSIWETFGVVYIEAMACGKPVIASDIPGPNEFINEDVGILVPPGDVDALAQAIDFMLDNHSAYSPDTLAAYVRDRFSYEVVAKKLDDIYREVVTK